MQIRYIIDPSHKSHNASDKYPIMHHFTIWCIEGYGTGALWDLWNRSTWMLCIDIRICTVDQIWFYCYYYPPLLLLLLIIIVIVIIIIFIVIIIIIITVFSFKNSWCKLSELCWYNVQVFPKNLVYEMYYLHTSHIYWPRSVVIDIVLDCNEYGTG